MKRLIAMIALGMGTAALAQTPPPAAPAPAKKVVVHKKVHAQTHTRTVTHTPSADGVAHTNVTASKTVKTPTGTHTQTVTKKTATKPQG